ncbi:hypothetical protein BsWGS_24128 [Bradybaena similaris]
MASYTALNASGECEIVDIVPHEEYDSERAKLRASLSWLLSKVYGSSIPKELQDPFYETAEGQLILRPVLVNLMSSSELYCQACSNLFPETHTQWQGHWSIIQVLSRKGIYISEVQESAVTETVLVQTAPFRLKAHLALIDALMKAYVHEVASVERVVQAVRRITTFPASSELPANPEEALVFWVNKVCTVLGIEGVSKGKAEEVSDGAGGQKVRVVKASPHQEPVQVPLLEDLMRDIGDGCSLAAVIAYYKPQLLCIKDLYLKEGIGTADALHNLQQIENFCQSYFPCRCFHLSYEDLLYTHSVMKVNILAFLADLFHGLEGPDPCQGESGGLWSPRTSAEKVDAYPAAGKKSSQTVHGTVPVNQASKTAHGTVPVSQASKTIHGAFPVSQATKRSFHRPGLEETASNLGMGRSAVTSPIFQPLLSKRISGRHCIPQEEGGISLSAPSAKRSSSRRALSLSTAQDRELVNKSLLAWQDDQRLQHRSSTDATSSNPYTRLSANASLESAVNRNRNSNSNLGLDFSNLESPCQDYMEFDSLTLDHPHLTHPHQQADRWSNRTPTAVATDQKLEPLMPALLRPAKERQTSLSKAEESGDRSPRRRKVMPSTDQTPVASLVQRSTALSPVSPGGRSQSPYQKSQPQGSRGKAFEAFVVGPSSEATASLEAKSKQGISGTASQSALQRVADISPAGSYTVQDRARTVQAARAAGIPVVSDSEDTLLTASRSREGSIASSGEYSDHESQKIHQEYKVRESGIVTPRDAKITEANISNNGSSKPVMLISDHLSGDPTKLDGDDHGVFNKLSSKTTNFAELKRLKDKLGYNLDRMDRSALIYMQSGSHGGPYDKMSGVDLKSSFVSKQGQSQPQSNGDSNKTGGTEPNPQMSRSADMTDNAALEASETNPGSLELQQLRLKLEQKRKDIERKKHRQEAQHNKMRQQLGKAAFMRVVSKHADGTVEGESPDQADTARLDQSASQIQLQARLGQLHQKSPAGGSPGHQLPAHLNTLHATLGQNSVIPANVSAQRFTDWRTMSRGGGGGGVSASPIGDNQFGSKDQAQLLQARAGAPGGSSNMGSAYSSATPETSRNKAFSRAGMQQTIDNVRNKWFKSDSDLISSGRAGSGDEDADGDSFRLHGDDLLAGARAGTMQEPIHKSPSLQNQSPLQGTSQSVPTQFAGMQVSASFRDTGSPPMSDLEYEVYDSSLHKLNSSLTELQGEIMRLSLQHEQFKAAQSPVSGLSPRLSDGSVVGLSPSQSRPIHGIPQQVPFPQGAVTRTNGPSSSSHKQLPPLAQAVDIATPPINRDSFTPGVSDISPQTRPAYESEPSPAEPRQETSDAEDVMNVSNDGFFVSFGEKTTPKRHKPKLAEHRARGASPAPNAGLAAAAAAAAAAQTPLTVMGSNGGISDDVAANLANQAIVATVNIQKDSDELSSPSIGFVIKDESPAATEAVGDDEMQKKRIKLMEMQRKRKDDLEKKRLEKEAETARKLEEKLLKEEEQERKKAEEKARRELIFQQYLQKKQEEDDTPAKPTPKKRDASASKQRPKSMFVKKAMTPEPGALAPDSGSSSQEDLTGRGTMSGRSTPSVMSALRSAFHFRLPEPSKIRKAVSCNTLQGATNGATGPSTYRRPPSPDLNKARQQRQRGSSQESGSETGSGSNPGSDYAGPKLFVKPSAKSNRHIIVNAISHCCLAGSVNTDMKNKVLEELQKCDANHFLILFRDAGCQYRGLFIFYPETEEAFKVLGVGPKHIVNAMCEKFYKYNSGAKSFSEITSTKHLSVSVDAVVLYTAVWKSGKAVIKR